MTDEETGEPGAILMRSPNGMWQTRNPASVPDDWEEVKDLD